MLVTSRRGFGPTRATVHGNTRIWNIGQTLARLLERGKFDGLFIADVLGVYDVYNGSNDAAIRHATQVPVNDPLALVTPMALVTEHLGFGLTASLSFEHPYPFARRLSTLDHLTKGRVGWNIVTSYLESGARQHWLQGANRPRRAL
ncbi:Nitrilotriacetate monooxygenase component A [Ewingella americana]|uniref:Nitrilotriacetate monooxygenase component A n=1 Tax=Ewingella americana TaxID=41202 RepID=A0A377NEM0_9GAMM|nr:Nitrilotriacetate monooxygenase component A [Ewingella americana]